MKSFAVVFAFCLVGAFANIAEEQKAKLKEHKVACIKESGADEAAVEKLKNGEQVPLDDKLNCFAACMLKKVGVMKADGTIDKEAVRAKIPHEIPKDKVDQVLKSCEEQVGKKECETGGKVLSCLLKTKTVTLLQ